METVKLTSMVKTSGCAAKLDPAQLHSVLDSLPVMQSEQLLEGYECSDDALVYRLADGKLMLQTVDFFPPMVDDPYIFGQVAAANALSDIWAMGGEPKVALNLVCFPSCLSLDVLKEILLGGQSKVAEAGAIIAGGHTISDPTPKYGLSVTGFIDSGDAWANHGAREGDVLILTKSLGVGIINTAVKAGSANKAAEQKAIQSMTELNKGAYEAAKRYTVHAATDVTGFSLLGHAHEMASASKLNIVIESKQLPIIEEAKLLAKQGFIPGGLYNNRNYLQDKVAVSTLLAQEINDILFDPQTSGGLLLSMSESEGLAYSRETGYPIIGYVKKFDGRIVQVL